MSVSTPEEMAQYRRELVELAKIELTRGAAKFKAKFLADREKAAAAEKSNDETPQ